MGIRYTPNSGGDIVTEKREPLTRWRCPEREALLGNVFPSGKPPFAHFPTVTNLLNVNLCPVAVYHDLIHGIDDALIGRYPLERRGDLFHKFLAHLKLSLKNEKFKLSGYDTQAQSGMIKDLFLRFSQRRGFSMDAASDIWRLYIAPWVQRKLQQRELENISRGDQIFFEVSVSNAHVPFSLDSGIKHYPLRGRIDEVDLTKKRIIERTIKGTSSDAEPPLLKGYQVWLLWEILSSLKYGQLPPPWSSIDFKEFELIVETPFNDFPISKENPNWVMNTHYGYAWINDISISESPGVFREVFENAACTPISPHTECEHKFLICFPCNYPYPQSRPGIKQTFKPWYRLLLWEQIWEGHLLQYQLLMLERNELKELGLISEGKIISFSDDKIELEISGKEVSSVRGYERYTIVPFGTLFCGKKINATLISVDGNRFIMEIEDEEVDLSKDAILLPPQSEPPPIMREPPIHLKKQMQNALLRLQNSGVIKPGSAQSKSLIQLLEGVFGRRPLRRSSR